MDVHSSVLNSSNLWVEMFKWCVAMWTFTGSPGLELCIRWRACREICNCGLVTQNESLAAQPMWCIVNSSTRPHKTSKHALCLGASHIRHGHEPFSRVPGEGFLLQSLIVNTGAFSKIPYHVKLTKCFTFCLEVLHMNNEWSEFSFTVLEKHLVI